MRTRELFALLAAAASFTLLSAISAHARVDRYERAMVNHINGLRAGQGLGPLQANRRLTRSADVHSRDMLARDFFAHDSSNGASFARRVHRYLRAAQMGEVLAHASQERERPDPGLLVDAWARSPQHRELLLTPGFGRIGIACRTGLLGRDRALVCTADLASRR